ncbi:zf-PARP-domain-containing protein [Agrocybe pediades]|nr:zf-PARP-domain-containing protein [Agrocybe pediades]
MSEKTTGYRLEYAASARSKCKGPKPCSGTAIGKGELRFGTLIDMRGMQSFVWRHWGCVTPKILENVKSKFEEASEVDGFEDLKPEDQERLTKAWADGHVADEDIPPSARKPEGEDDAEEKPKKAKKAPAKKKAAEGSGEEAAEKPKKARATKAKV